MAHACGDLQTFVAGRLTLRVWPDRVEIVRAPLLPWRHPICLRLCRAAIVDVRPLAWGRGLLLVTVANRAITLALGGQTEAAFLALITPRDGPPV